MLKADLYFYPDAGHSARTRIGSVLFLVRDGGQGIVGFYEAAPGVLLKAQAVTESALLTTILNDFHGFIQRTAASIQLNGERTEHKIADAFIATLPHNIRATEPDGWPPDEAFFSAAEGTRNIEAYLVG